jgi:hypothetical protein
MDSKKYQFSGGMSTFSLLGIVFITLKLCSVINWPWWLVLAPFWVPIAIAMVLLVAAGICFLLVRRMPG